MINLEISEVLKYCIRHPKSRTCIKNVVYAPKLFLINSVLISLQEKINNKLFNEDNVDYYLECVIGYINEYYDLVFENNELRIIPHY